MSRFAKIVLFISLAVITPVALIYSHYFWHFPRSTTEEKFLIRAIENIHERRDTNTLIRLDSLVPSAWHRALYVGAYTSVPEETEKCKLNFRRQLRHAPINAHDHYNALLFFNEDNELIKYLHFEDGTAAGFATMYPAFPCGVTREQAVFKLRFHLKDSTYRLQLAN